MGVAFKKDTFYAMTAGIVEQGFAKFASDAFTLCIRRYGHLSQFEAAGFWMWFQRTAAHDLSAVIDCQKYLTATTYDAVIDMRKGVQIRLLQPEPGLYPLFVQSDKVLLVLRFVSDNSYHFGCKSTHFPSFMQSHNDGILLF